MKHQVRFVAGILSILALATIVVGCGNTSKSSSNSSTTTRTVTDMSGTKVKLPTQVSRVADLWHANNQVVMLLGGQKKLVATTQMIKTEPWINAIFPGISKVKAPFSGEDMQIEALLKTKPDVVISSDPGQIKQARNAKLPTVNAMYQDFAGLRRSVNLTANVLGGNAPKVAKNYQKDLTSNLNYVKTQLKGVTNKPKVLHIVNSTNLNVVDGQNTIVDEWIKAAGGQNALSQKGNMISVTTEKLAKSNPDVIIVGSTTTANALKALKKRPRPQQTDCGQNWSRIRQPTRHLPVGSLQCRRSPSSALGCAETTSCPVQAAPHDPKDASLLPEILQLSVESPSS